jgi:hypothetical protein
VWTYFGAERHTIFLKKGTGIFKRIKPDRQPHGWAQYSEKCDNTYGNLVTK